MAEIVVGKELTCLDCGKELGDMTEKLKGAMEDLDMEDDGWYCSECFHKKFEDD